MAPISISDAIEILERNVHNPSAGLPDEVFYYISKTTPLVNVDLLIKDEQERTLLSWRDDQYAGKGWHVPGGIVRFRETLEARIQKVADSELSVTDIRFDPVPIAMNQFIHHNRIIRSHFISFLYKCFLSSTFVPQNKGLSAEDRGYLMWHNGCPDNLIKVHSVYKKHLT